MNINYIRYAIPVLGTLCAAGAIAIGVAIKAPVELDFSTDTEATYSARVPEKLELNRYIPTMEEVVEKHLFVKERKASGANTFPDLLVKGVYIGSQCNAVFSLKSKPEANLRVWQGDVDAAMGLVKDERDPRQPIVEFLSEWEIVEITFSGVKVEHIITGETEEYAVNYTPTKPVKDSAGIGYGQGLVSVETGSGKNVKAAARTATARSNAPATSAQQMFGRMGQLMRQMTPEQRDRMRQFMSRGQVGVSGDNANGQDRNSSNVNEKKSSNKNNDRKSKRSK